MERVYEGHAHVRADTLPLPMAETETLPASMPTPAGEPAPELSVVVTLYNEAGSLDELHRRAIAALDGLGRPFEIVYVDDGSTDGTFAVLERAPRGRRPRARGPLQAELRPASRDARGAVPGARRDRRDDGRRPPEPAGGHPEARRGDRRRLRRRERAARGAQRLLGPDAPVPPDQRHAAPVHAASTSPTSAAPSMPTGAKRRDADARVDRPAEVHEGARSSPAARR